MTTNNGTPAAATPAPPSTDVSEYLDRFRGRAPSEMLGFPKESSLMGPFVIALLSTGVLFAALTAGPYFASRSNATPPAESGTPAEQPKAEAAKPEKEKPATPAAPAVASTPTPAVTPTAGTPPKVDITKKLGETDVKTASPKVNPLDKSADDLFKDIDK